MSTLLDGQDLALTANGTTIASTAVINKFAAVSQFTTTTSAANACRLPSAPVPNAEYVVKSSGAAANAASLQIFVYQAGDTIDGAASTAPVTLPKGSSISFLAPATVTAGAVAWVTKGLFGPSTVAVAAVTALAGGAQPTAAANMVPVNQFFTRVATVASVKDSIGLPAAPVLMKDYTVYNAAGATVATSLTLAVWPGDGVAASSFNGLAANTPLYIGSGASMKFTALSNTAGVIEWLAHGYSGPVPVLLAPATRAIEIAEGLNGAVIQLTQAGGAAAVLTLPDVATAGASKTKGLKFKFVMPVSNTAGTATIRVTGAGTHMVAVTRAATTVASVNLYLAGVDLVYAQNNLAGAWSEHICDGVNYYAFGVSHIATGFTAA